MKIAALRAATLINGASSLAPGRSGFCQKKRESLERLGLQLQERGPLKALERDMRLHRRGRECFAVREQVQVGDAVAITARGKLSAEVKRRARVRLGCLPQPSAGAQLLLFDFFYFIDEDRQPRVSSSRFRFAWQPCRSYGGKKFK